MTIGRPTRAAILGFRGWRALRHRNFRLFFAGQLVSLIGTWMQAVAPAGPGLVLGLFGGLSADGLPKRQTLIATQTISMILAFVLFGLTATHAVHVNHILVLALLLGCVNAIDMPTRQAFAVEMVGRGGIGNAVALT